MEGKTTQDGGAERAARITAAKAVLGDFRRDEAADADWNGPAMPWATWAGRLAVALSSVLDAPAPRRALPGLESIVRQALRDAIRYQEATQKRGYRGQIALYRECARLIGISIGKL